MKFAEILQKLMDGKGLTNYELAKNLDVHPTTIANWLDGKEPRKKTLLQLSEYFGVSTDYLLGNEPKGKPLINGDEELTEYLEELKNRSEMRMLFSLAKGATKADVEKAVAIIEALRRTEKGE